MKSKVISLVNRYHFYALILLLISLSFINYFYLIILFIYIIYLIKTHLWNNKILIFMATFILIFSLRYVSKSKLDISKEKINAEIINVEIKENNKYKARINDEDIIIYDKELYKEGDIVEFNGTFNKVSNFSDYDYKSYLKSKKIYYTFSSKNSTYISFNKDIYHLKGIISSYFDSYLNDKTKMFFNSLILGKNINDLDFKDNLNTLGISYMFVISGFHISLLVLFIDKILSKFKTNPIIGDTIVGLVLFIYCFIIGFSVGVLRAFFSYIISKINIHLGLSLTSLDKISINYILLSFINPLFIFQTGFRFSFVASLFIVLSRNIIKSDKLILKTYLTSIICFISSIPILVNANSEINLLALLIGPILLLYLTYIIIPYMYLLVFIPSLRLNIILDMYTNIVNRASNIDLFIINIKEINPIFVGIYYILLVLFLISLEEKKNYKHCAYYLAFLMILISVKCVYPFKTLTMINVGQGDSFILQDKDKVMLIDSYGSNIDYIKKQGINKIDVLVITHSDNDHIGSAIDVVKKYNVDKLILNKYENSDTANELKKYVKSTYYLKSGDNFNFGNNICYVLGPNVENKEINNNSLVFYTTVGNKKILFTGDMEKEEENNIFNKKLYVDILKVPHHGSNSSLGDNFMKNVSFKTCLISCGEYNKYKHPSSDTLNKIKYCNYYISYETGSLTINLESGKVYKYYSKRKLLNYLDCLTKINT